MGRAQEQIRIAMHQFGLPQAAIRQLALAF